MGQNRSQIEEKELVKFKDPENMNVVIEKSKSAKVGNEAEGMYIIPKSTNCVNLSDLIFSLVKSPIVLYICGQEVTHNYTPISMFASLLEDDYLYFIYADAYEKPEESYVLEEYIKEAEIDLSGPLRVILRPGGKQLGPVKKVKVWDDCTVKQLGMVIEKLIRGEVRSGVELYCHEKKLCPDLYMNDLKNLIRADGNIHLTYHII